MNWRQLKVITYEKVPTHIQNDIDLIYLEASSNNSNYSKSELKEPIIGTTVVYEDKLLVGVSSILMRDIYNIPRIMNRYYYNDGSRGMIPKNFTGKIRGTSVEMIDQQVDLVFKLGYEGAFTSREKFKGYERFFTGIKETSQYDWETDYEKRYCVNYNSQNDNNWQLIMWTGKKYEHSKIKEGRPGNSEEILLWRNRPINTRGYRYDYNRRLWGIRSARPLRNPRSSNRRTF